MTAKDYPFLRGFLACAFVDYDDRGDDSEGARDFARTQHVESVQSVLREASELITSDDDLLGIVSDGANRYFESFDEAIAWLTRMCDAMRKEIPANPEGAHSSKWDSLSFLRTDFGMVLLVDSESEARFVRDNLEVVLYAQPYEVGLELRLRGPDEDTPSESYMPHELCPGTERIAGHFMYHDPAQIPRLLILMGAALREGCESVLTGSIEEFAEAAERSETEFQKFLNQQTRRPAIEAAEEAWRRRDYATVFAALCPISELLTPVESRKLDYATKKLGSQDGAGS